MTHVLIALGMIQIEKKTCEREGCTHPSIHYNSSEGHMCQKHRDEYWDGVDEI